MSGRQYAFLEDCLQELNKALTRLGQPLIIKVGDAVSVLMTLYAQFPDMVLWSHQETWNGWTYQRDRAVLTWCRRHQILWHQPPQHGVVRCLKSRDGWAAIWYQRMQQPVLDPPPSLVTLDCLSDTMPTADALKIKPDDCPLRQVGGRSKGLEHLHSFLHSRGMHYTKEMSSPVTAFDSCSRLSPYLAFGVLSMREVFHAVEERKQGIKQMPYGTKGPWNSAMRSLSARLRWHCHFMQKLEDMPDLEYVNLHPAYDTLRQDSWNPVFYEAWCTGKTGYPMIDACMRCLHQTGWINFRMRAMLVSFASYHLWLPWQKTAHYLATQFTDYEPGIHYSQVQMQSGTTGINSVRIYNPIKQGIDQDPDGVFIRTWIPELHDVPHALIHTPWLDSTTNTGYPKPIVDEKTARTFAASQIYAVRKTMQHKQHAAQIVKKHGSRKKSRQPTQKNTPKQPELPLWKKE